MCGETKRIDWKRLTEPFAPQDIEWRVGRAGKNAKGVWATVLAYITARAIQERLDEVFGPGGWKNEFRDGPKGGVICRIYFRNDEGEWVWREDGAENTDVEAVKGGLSGAMKRAGSALGIGRYLYRLDEGWANIHAKGANYQSANEKKGIPAFRWDPPDLPAWALPGGSETPPETDADPETGEVEEESTEEMRLADKVGMEQLVARANGLVIEALGLGLGETKETEVSKIKRAIDARDAEKIRASIVWLEKHIEEAKESDDLAMAS